METGIVQKFIGILGVSQNVVYLVRGARGSRSKSDSILVYILESPYLWKLANSFGYCGKASASAGSSGLSCTVSDADPKP